jgi:hypothetical protein
MANSRLPGTGPIEDTPGGARGRAPAMGGQGQSDADRGLPGAVMDQARDVVSNTSDTVRSAYDQGQQYAREVSDRYPQARRYFEDGSRAISGRVAEAPLLSLVAVGAVAYGLAWVLHGGQSSSTGRLSRRVRPTGDFPGQRTGKALVESDRVEGTAVYDLGGKNIGTIKRVMIDKISGRVAYAVMSFGGFLGFGTDEYAIPWNKLDYDTRMEGYRTDITEDQLRNAPSFSKEGGRNWSERNERDLHDYYRVSYYWIVP